MISLGRSFATCLLPRLTPIVLGLAALSPVLAPASNASALVTKVNTGSGITTVGLQPRNTEFLLDGESETAASFSNAGGSPVLHSVNTYAVYWDPGDRYHGDWQHLIDTFFRDMGTAGGSLGNVFAVDAQYTDTSNRPASNRPVFRGAYTDTGKYPSPGCTDPQPTADAIVCLTDKQIRSELEAFISTSQHGLQKGMGTIYYLLTPPGVTVCVDGGPASHCSDKASSPSSFCSYHSDINPDSSVAGDASTVLYAVIPWTAGGLADGQLAPEDRTPAYDCQDGGFDPSSKPIEQREKSKEKNKKEQEEFEAKSNEEKETQEKAEQLAGPHQEEPNQVPCPSPDGYCDTGLSDLIINQIAVEQQNTVTNPLLNAWQDSGNKEATDECRNFFAPKLGGAVTANENTGAGTLFNQSLGSGNYYLNIAFNLAALRLPYPAVPCIPGVSLEPQFTAPNTVNAGDIVDFDGMESDISLNAAISFSSGGVSKPNYARYTWDFGDGTPTVSGYAPGAPSMNSPSTSPCEAPWLAPCAASTFHIYQYGGTYQVTLTATDVAGNTAEVTKPITVAGPPPPSSEPAKEGPSGSSTPTAVAGSTVGASAPPGASTHSVPPIVFIPSPIASAAVTSKSLSKVLRKGLVVRYSVNEQVAGRFEVLLTASIARRLGIHGPLATGLPAGSAPSIVIAKAILVTTKGGRNTVKILFARQTAARLRKLSKVTLTLRMIVRNSSSQSPKSTTILSTITLHR